MRRAILFITVGSLLAVAIAVGGGRTAAQTSTGPIRDSSQLRLPTSAFPGDYEGDEGEAWPASHADTSSFHQMHVKTYTELGMQGAWYQYYAKQLVMSSNGALLVGPVEVVYLGTYYPNEAAAENAFSDILSNPQNGNPTTCSYGTRCVTYSISLNWQGPTYTGLARIVQRGNAVAEIRADVFQNMSSLVSADTFTTNVDRVSQAFVQAVDSLMPTSTPIPPTATPTATPTPAPTATATSIPVSFDVVSVRAEKYRSKPDMSLQRAPLKTVKVGTKVYLSIYTIVRSAPPGSSGTSDFRLTSAGRVVLHRTRQMTVSSSKTTTYRGTATFAAAKAGSYTFRGTVTIDGESRQSSTTIRVVK